MAHFPPRNSKAKATGSEEKARPSNSIWTVPEESVVNTYTLHLLFWRSDLRDPQLIPGPGQEVRPGDEFDDNDSESYDSDDPESDNNRPTDGQPVTNRRELTLADQVIWSIESFNTVIFIWGSLKDIRSLSAF